VVLASVRKNGLCLKDASDALRQNEDIVREACINRALALRHCAPGPTSQRLAGDKSFMLNIFAWLQDSRDSEPRIWEMLSPSLKNDRDLVLAAQASKSLAFADLPQALTCDPDFWMDVITRDSSFWFALPDKYKDDPSFVRSIKTFESDEQIIAIFDRFPFLSSDRDVWEAIIDSSEDQYYDFLPNLIRDHAPDKIRLDKDLMVWACKNRGAVIEILSPQLQQNREIVEAVLEHSYDPFEYFPKAAQCAFPDLVVKAISNIDFELHLKIDDFLVDIAEELWKNLDVTRAWIKAGGVIHDKFPEAMLNSKQFGLAVAEYQTRIASSLGGDYVLF
jgi:hypothetical protein